MMRKPLRFIWIVTLILQAAMILYLLTNWQLVARRGMEITALALVACGFVGVAVNGWLFRMSRQ